MGVSREVNLEGGDASVAIRTQLSIRGCSSFAISLSTW